jgi:hypothetical protein
VRLRSFQTRATHAREEHVLFQGFDSRDLTNLGVPPREVSEQLLQIPDLILNGAQLRAQKSVLGSKTPRLESGNPRETRNGNEDRDDREQADPARERQAEVPGGEGALPYRVLVAPDEQ